VRTKLYKTYSFRTKDPVIDALRGTVNGKGYGQLSQDSGVSSTTLYNWFYGPTKRPQFATIAAVARAIGPEGIEAVVKCMRSKM